MNIRRLSILAIFLLINCLDDDLESSNVITSNYTDWDHQYAVAAKEDYENSNRGIMTIYLNHKETVLEDDNFSSLDPFGAVIVFNNQFYAENSVQEVQDGTFLFLDDDTEVDPYKIINDENNSTLTFGEQRRDRVKIDFDITAVFAGERRVKHFDAPDTLYVTGETLLSFL